MATSKPSPQDENLLIDFSSNKHTDLLINLQSNVNLPSDFTMTQQPKNDYATRHGLNTLGESWWQTSTQVGSAPQAKAGLPGAAGDDNQRDGQEPKKPTDTTKEDTAIPAGATGNQAPQSFLGSHNYSCAAGRTAMANKHKQLETAVMGWGFDAQRMHNDASVGEKSGQEVDQGGSGADKRFLRFLERDSRRVGRSNMQKSICGSPSVTPSNRCRTCGASFTTTDRLFQHIYTECDKSPELCPKPFPCRRCHGKENFDTTKELDRHLLVAHDFKVWRKGF